MAGAAAPAALAAAVLTATAVSAVLGALARACGPVDRPRGRGAHDRPTPTSGGLGIIAGSGAGVLFAERLGALPREGAGPVLAALGFSAALGLLGALDDLLDLDPRLKLLVQSALALGAAALTAGPALDLLHGPLGPRLVGLAALGVAAAWIILVVNAVNFMDGANGIAAGSAAIMLSALALAAALQGRAALAAGALVPAAAVLGFLPWNFPRARLFQGDAGSLFTGCLLASLCVAGAAPGGVAAPSAERGAGLPLVFGPILMTPFLVDVLLTLVRRGRAGARLFEAHAEHLYQRWLQRTGRSHAALAGRVLPVVGLYAVAALLALALAPGPRAGLFALGVLAAAGVWTRLRRV